MSNPDRSIDPRIQESARAEFLSKPYEKVSLREICRRAGVTTGALYKRYQNKEELFDALGAGRHDNDLFAFLVDDIRGFVDEGVAVAAAHHRLPQGTPIR